MKSFLGILLAGGLMGAAPANAQATRPMPRGMVAVTAGAQTIDTLTTSSEFELFGRRGTIETLRRRADAPLFDITGSHRIFGHLAAGLTFARTRTKQLVTYTARVPIAPDTTQIFPVADTYQGAEHAERQLHFFASWVLPFNEKVAVDFSGGPSVLSIKHDSLIGMTMPQLFVTKLVVTKDSDTTMGYHARFGLRARLVKNVGLAFGIRYVRADADLSTGEYRVRGLHIGAGCGLLF